MNNVQLYKWATIFLFLINMGMLTFFFATKPSHPNEDRFRQTVKEELNLNSSQEKLFLKSAEKHSEQINALNNQQKELWIAYFNTLKTTSTSTKKDSISLELQQIELQKVKLTYLHFEEVKSFLNPNHDWLELSRKRMTHPGLTLFGDWDGKAFEPWPETV